MQIEVHITTNEIQQAAIDSFIDFCKHIDAKPIIIELGAGEVLQHPMISKRIKAADREELNGIIEGLKAEFLAAGYAVARVKLEVYYKHANEAQRLFFPEYKGGYYEWHGKVFSDKLDEVHQAARRSNVHVSQNGLKGIKNRRILTMRTTHTAQAFTNRIDQVKRNFKWAGIEIAGEELEYCIFDSNKSLDKGWIDTPEITDSRYLNLLSFEAFLRRAAKLDLPFMLKGSIVTRQFFANKEDRVVQDLDYLYFGKVRDDVDFMDSELSNWVEAVTTTTLSDGVVYRPFSENRFWRAIDYAMSDDFPTTNTDLYCTVGTTVNPDFGLDVSWGLPMNVPPASLLYHPVEGEPFEIPFVAPMPLQVSWKLHQCVVRPRLKDLIDIVYLLEQGNVSDDDLEVAVEEYVKECEKDGIDSRRLLKYIEGDVRQFVEGPKRTGFFGLKKTNPPQPLSNMGQLTNEDITYLRHIFPNYLPRFETIEKILLEFEAIMQQCDFAARLQRRTGGSR